MVGARSEDQLHLVSVVNYSEKSYSFFEDVWGVVKLIPEGKVTSYGAIAKYLGSPGASRMVGWAMNACHRSDIKIPAHRVVNRSGLLTGKIHFGEPDAMQVSLENEGIKIQKNQIQDFKTHFWNPMDELDSDLTV
ncbi:MAG: methylated-DNA-protein-cysteine methyltransferase-like protein [Granulosicoccus sp.]